MEVKSGWRRRESRKKAAGVTCREDRGEGGRFHQTLSDSSCGCQCGSSPRRFRRQP